MERYQGNSIYGICTGGLPVTYVVSQPHDVGRCIPGADAGKHTCSSKSDEGRRKERPDGKAAQENAQEEAEENELTEMDEEPEEMPFRQVRMKRRISKMTAIYKRELKSYFQSMTGYVLIAFLVIFTGNLFYGVQLKFGDIPIFHMF